PPCFTTGNILKDELVTKEKVLLMETQTAYLKLKSRRLDSNLAQCDRTFDSQVAFSRRPSPPYEPHAKIRKLSDGERNCKMGRRSIDSCSESDSAGEEEEMIDVELDEEEMDEMEMMDSQFVLVDTSRAAKVQMEKNEEKM
ncbi:hypothetical protein PFISCL1PPCAC_1353, partial [Pristionchus fissidentatus]